MYLARFELHPRYISYIIGLGNRTAGRSPGLGREKMGKADLNQTARTTRRSSNVIVLGGTKFAILIIVTVELILRSFGPGLDG